eukprot:scaffold833_cov92-Cylindrotheca_fusiformis.AAC.3
MGRGTPKLGKENPLDGFMPRSPIIKTVLSRRGVCLVKKRPEIRIIERTRGKPPEPQTTLVASPQTPIFSWGQAPKPGFYASSGFDFGLAVFAVKSQHLLLYRLQIRGLDTPNNAEFLVCGTGFDPAYIAYGA